MIARGLIGHEQHRIARLHPPFSPPRRLQHPAANRASLVRDCETVLLLAAWINITNFHTIMNK